MLFMSQGILLVVDNESDAVIYGGREWQWSHLSRWYGGSSTWPAFAPGLNGSPEITYGSFNFSFHGTAVAFYGNTATRFQNATVSIDGGSPYNSSFPDPSSQEYLQWYQSPQLQEGNHTISLTNLADVSVDFIVVAAGPNTPLSGQTVIVDDDDPSIHYTGSWDRDGGLFSPDPSTSNPSGYPFHNGTHQSSTEGDVLTLEFTGTSINISGYLIFPLLAASLLYLIWRPVDTSDLCRRIRHARIQAGVGYQPNFHYFSQSPLAGATIHSLSASLSPTISLLSWIT
ncbi:hypothetical protein BD779DRAFT_198002 [Infundibulicybe gibba]|nr:hypothetical protein BD779DRAFT_198002 [Infundibulicybe gibba]